MNQHEFNALLEKYLAGACSEEEEKLVERWAEELVQQSPPPLSPAEKVLRERRLWNRLRSRTQIRFWSGSARAVWVRVAAVLVLVAGLGWYWSAGPSPFLAGGDQSAQPQGVIRIQNTSDKPRRVTLEDGTLVVLTRASSISYPEHFGNRTRSVLLEGEAFFQVKRDPDKPFVVHTGELVTEVLGTSFTIRSFDNNPSIEVRVLTGRVSVYDNRAGRQAVRRNGVLLTPNQRVVFDKASRQLVSGLVEKPVIIQPPAAGQPFLFEERPLSEVLKVLEEAFGVQILLENKALASCKLTADLSELTLYEQLEMICKTVNATYEQRGTVLFLNGDGCREPN